jgi:DUF4097 and DUF4098 domain-containing protein YvlB
MKPCSRSLLAAILLATSATSLAGTPINESRDVDANARIEISNVRGSVTVSVWDQARVQVSGTLGSGSKGLSITGSSSNLEIEVRGPEQSGWFNWGSSARMEDTILDVRLPRTTELTVETVSADITVTGVEGRLLDTSSVSGKIRLDSTARDLEVGRFSGTIEFSGSGDRAHVDTVSGDIDLRSSHREMKLETVSGNILAAAGTYREFSGSSVSGDIALRGTPATDARVSAETMSGDVSVTLPPSASARLDAETFSGRIRSDFGSVEEPEHGPGRSLDTTIGNGDARFTIETFSGDIDIRSEK